MIDFVVEDGSGLANATSYVSVEEADDIASLNIHNSDAWQALDPDAKQRLLMYASQVLDSRTTWNGTQSTTAQALAWPRSGVKDWHGNTVSPTSVPYAVRWAVVELAKHNMTEDRLAKSQPDAVVSEVKAEGITVRFAAATQIAMSQYRTPDIVSNILKGLGTVRNSFRKVTFGKLSRA